MDIDKDKHGHVSLEDMTEDLALAMVRRRILFLDRRIDEYNVPMDVTERNALAYIVREYLLAQHGSDRKGN